MGHTSSISTTASFSTQTSRSIYHHTAHLEWMWCLSNLSLKLLLMGTQTLLSIWTHSCQQRDSNACWTSLRIEGLTRVHFVFRFIPSLVTAHDASLDGCRVKKAKSVTAKMPGLSNNRELQWLYDRGPPPLKVNFTSRYNRKNQLSCNELEEYFKLLCEDFDTCKPLRWWVEWQAQFPTLYCLTQDLLMIPGMFLFTSV
jgi:hypothetical protein